MPAGIATAQLAYDHIPTGTVVVGVPLHGSDDDDDDPARHATLAAIAGDANENLGFYSRSIGMRLVKRSVNQDAVDTYHLFYADGEGRPGTDLTFFPWPNMGPSRPGTGLAGEVALAVAPVAVGCAAGLLLSRHVKRKRRRALASLCLSAGVVATLPLAIDLITKTLDSPARPRGSDRRLRGIRSSGLYPDADVIGGEEYFVDRLT